MRTAGLFLAGLAIVAAAHAGAVPRPAPELIMERTGQPPLKLSQFRGKIVALAFMQTTCSHCQDLTRILKVIQKDYASRNVQVVECAFEDDVAVNYPMFLKAFEPNFPSGYSDRATVKKYLQWNDAVHGMLMVPYMIFIDAKGTIRADFDGKDGFFVGSDQHIRSELDKMLKGGVAAPAAKKK